MTEPNYSDWFQAKIKIIREESGDIKTIDPLVHFMYILMRDYATVGVPEKILEDMEWERAQGKLAYNFTNGWLAQYAQNISTRLGVLAQESIEQCQTSNIGSDSPKLGKRTRRSTSKR